MTRYICEVRSDPDNNELELVHTNKYGVLPGSSAEPGAIRFKNNDEFNRYFTNHCISRAELKEAAREQGSIFTLLFLLLLLVFIITIIVQVCNSGKNGYSSSASPTAVGRFSF